MLIHFPRFTSLSAAAGLALSALTGCSHSIDPCPLGMVPDDRGDHCVLRSAVHGDDAGDDTGHHQSGDGDHPGDGDKGGSVDPDAGDGDAGDGDAGDGDAGMDGGHPPAVDGGPDTRMDGGHEHEPDAGQDAGTTHLPDASRDGGPDTNMCSPEGITAWEAFYAAEGLVQHIHDCATDTSCGGAACPLDDCLRRAAAVDDCKSCVSAEVSCVALNCQEACGGSTSDSECRACACTHQCIAAFNDCSGSTADLCADTGIVPPELIMVVVDEILFAPVVTTVPGMP